MISWVWGRSICSPLPLKQGISSKLIQRCVLRCISYTVRFLSAKPVPRLWVLSVSFSTVLWWDYKPLQGDSSCAIEQNGNREGVLLILFQSRNLWSDWPCIESSFFILKNKIKKMEGKTPQKVTECHWELLQYAKAFLGWGVAQLAPFWSVLFSLSLLCRHSCYTDVHPSHFF